MCCFCDKNISSLGTSQVHSNLPIEAPMVEGHAGVLALCVGPGLLRKSVPCLRFSWANVALKLYLNDSKIMQSFCDDDKGTQKEWAMEIRDIEANKWRTHYPTYQEAIFMSELFEVPCLAMPYVALIPVEQCKSLLPKIRKELQRFAVAGLSYRNSDIRWHHIGLQKDYHGEELIILVDLESMQSQHKDKQVEGSPSKDEIEAVKSAVCKLERRAAGEPVQDPKELIHA